MSLFDDECEYGHCSVYYCPCEEKKAPAQPVQQTPGIYAGLTDTELAAKKLKYGQLLSAGVSSKRAKKIVRMSKVVNAPKIDGAKALFGVGGENEAR